MTALASFACGLLFAIGLGVSGMTQPSKVVAFLDITGNWDPSLALVMVGAIGVHALSYRWITRRRSPLLGGTFRIPGEATIDGRLLAGAAIFGIGWGMIGYCPGPAVAAVGGGTKAALWFVAAMIAGVVLYRRLDAMIGRRQA